MSKKTIISVHVPKCAGTSLRAAFDQQFGAANIYYDYNDSPFNPTKPVNTDPHYFDSFQENSYGFLNDKKLVHGHFHPNKYRALKNALHVTILREPVDRVISHYFHWKLMPRHNHPLHDYFLDHQLSLQAFAQLPAVQNFYSGIFFKEVDMQRFDAIGNYADMGTFLKRFKQLSGHTLSVPQINLNPEHNYSALKTEILSDATLIKNLRTIFARDTAFYERWTQI